MKINRLVVGLYEENCYIIEGDNNLIIIDPGDEFERIQQKIKQINKNVVGILLTHAHFDHIGALDNLLNEYNVPVYYNNVNNEIKVNKLINIEEKEYNIDEFNFKVIYTKGHRNDLCTFYFEKEQIMFTGDFLFKDTIGRTDLEYADYDEMIKSIDKIKQYDDNIKIYPGHGENTNLGYEKKNNIFFK